MSPSMSMVVTAREEQTSTRDVYFQLKICVPYLEPDVINDIIGYFK